MARLGQREHAVKVLVTGSRGFIGRSLCPELERAGHTVIPFTDDLLSPDPGTSAVVRRVRRIPQADALIHLAWDVGPGYQQSRWNLYWVEASLRLIRRFGEDGSRVICAGSAFELDAGRGTGSPYAVCKDALRRVARATVPNFSWARIFQPYGPGERPERLIPYVCRQLKAGQPVLCGSGLQMRDFIHVEDVARAFRCILESGQNSDFDIATGVSTPLRTVVQTIGEIAGNPELIQFGALVDSGAFELTTSAEMLPPFFKPEIALRDGLARAYAETT
jgi:nucleoside-diphosphate-sugar epimerase